MAETDEEQIEAIKKWWDENGKSILIGIVLALGGVFGYQAWDNHVRETGEAASALYEDMLAAMAMDDPFGTLDEERLATARFIAGQLKE
ncbi:MAG: tetratricopeptide repeat protein, partial [Pseudomonadales bacterium]